MHTVIVGGGFAGVKAAVELSKKKLGKITLISDQPYFLHHATLYATATGRNSRQSVIMLTDAFADHADIEIVQDTISGIDSVRKIVTSSEHSYHYDTLVLAMGVVTTYFNIDGLANHAYGIKTLDEVTKFKNHLHEILVADKHMDKNYVVIGAGPTGVELAAGLKEYLGEISKAHNIKRAKITIKLIEAADRILPRLSKTASKKVHQQLEKMGIEVLTNHKVSKLDSETLEVNGKKISSKTAVWTSGVTNHPFFAEHDDLFAKAADGRVQVDAFLRAHDDIYVIGDNASTKFTGTAWTAMAHAVFLAQHLKREITKASLVPYTPRKTADSIPVGDNWGYVEKWGVYIDGALGAWARRRIELRGYRQLLAKNQALEAWHAYDSREESCAVCFPSSPDHNL